MADGWLWRLCTSLPACNGCATGTCTRRSEPSAANLLGNSIHLLRREYHHLHKIRCTLHGAFEIGRVDTSAYSWRRNEMELCHQDARDRGHCEDCRGGR